MPRRSAAAAAVVLAAGAFATLAVGGVASGTVAWVILSVVPGAAMGAFLNRRTTPLQTLLAGLLFSPLITTTVASLMMLAGAGAAVCVKVILLGSSAAGAAALVTTEKTPSGLTRRELSAFALVVAVFVLLTGILPQASEWWRIRSDAWFHAAVVAQIRDFGLPPSDPYFAGVTLQYMWAYHVLVLVLTTASGLDVFRAMALVNVQALVAMLVATLLFARSLGVDFRRALASAALVPLGMSALFWAFLPIRFARAMLGATRGGAELAREFSLSPFTYDRVREFTTVWYNSEFFFDKFMVATAFSLALALLAACWYGASEFLRDGRRFALATVGLCVFGMLAFHPPVGLVALGALAGSAALFVAARRRLPAGATRRALVLAAAGLVALALAAPYLYSIMSARDAGPIPVGFSLNKLIGILISVALVATLSALQRPFLRRRDAQAVYIMGAIAGTILVSLLLRLPAANMYDKPAYFIYYPLAVIGAWTLLDLGERRGRRFAAWLFVALVVPINALSLASCYSMPTPAILTSQDRALARWVREHTQRDDIFVDDDSQVSLLVTGPRRYYYGRESYALQWRYDQAEMEKRRAAARDLLDDNVVTHATVDALDEIPGQIYVVVRGTDRRPAHRALQERGELFERVYHGNDISLYRYIGKKERQ